MQKSPDFPLGNGSSQAERSQKALDPGYIPVDERSIKDLLQFARAYAGELRYFNQNNEIDGDWSAFLGDLDPDAVIAWMNDPQAVPPAERAAFTRPHLVLFLTFLQLLQNARVQLNDLTRRHLEFYYREALRLTSQPGTPDQVHAIVELANGQNQLLLPAGSLLKAGQDSLGKDLVYRSERDLLVNRASVASLKTLFSEKMTIGIREARETPDVLAELFPANTNLVAEGKTSDRTFMAMLVMALGTPLPGGVLPAYPPYSSSPPNAASRSVTVAFLAQLDTLLAFVPASLYMPFSTFRALMQLKLKQTQSTNQWQQINNILEAAGKKRDKKFTLDRSVPDNFEKNLLAALGLASFDHFFDGLPEVDDVYDLYRRRDRDDVIDFIQKSMFMSVADFTTMMDMVEEINGRWRQIYEILRGAGRKKQLQIPTHQMQAPQIRTWDADKFGVLVARTLGTITYPVITGMPLANFDDCNGEISKLEAYFHVSAEDFVTIRATNLKQDAAQSWEWEQVYAILEAAHADKTLFDRRNSLKLQRQNGGFQGMVLFALGDPNPGDPLPDGRQFMQLNLDSDKLYITEKLFLDPANFTYVKNTAGKTTASDDEWNNVYAILEKAQSRKRGTPTARAEIEKWDNIYVADDATRVQVKLEAEGDAATPRWRTFGEGNTGGQVLTLPGNCGFALASPLLALAEGHRTITLTIAFREANFDKASVELALAAPSPLRFLLSTAKEMIEVQAADVSIKLLDAAFTVADKPWPDKTYQHALQITLSLKEQAPPIAPLAPAASQISTPWPLLQIMLADIPDTTTPIGGPTKRYRAFQQLALEKLFLRVDVSGLTSLTLQNDSSRLEAKKPFEPFGYAPVAGSSFYIAHAELCSKRLSSLKLNIDWLGVADDLSAYYLGYKDYLDPALPAASPILDNSVFAAKLRLFDNRAQFDMGNIQLFNAGSAKNTGASQTNHVVVGGDSILNSYPAYQRASSLAGSPAAQVLDWGRYWQLELQAPDFQHAIYPRVAAGCAAKLDSNKKAAPYIVNAPYTPKIKHLSLGYSATLEIDLSKTDLATLEDSLYHIEPFGYRNLAGIDPKIGPFFLPQFDNEGELYIGIRDLAPPQSLSLLFQLAEGSADPDLAREKVNWDYLDGNQWTSLEQGQLLSDMSNGLLNSGIIEFALAPASPGTRLPGNLYWLRASIARNSHSVANTVAIVAQALRATFVDQGNAPDHSLQPLPAGSIRALARVEPAVKRVTQPYSSFGGKSPEQAAHFYTRVSERLRHKNRALTSWDYEHLVLEAFPGIFKVKCLPVGSSGDPRLADVIQVIVIPDIKGQLPFDPFEPKLPADVLLQIEQYLGQHCAPFAKFKVQNPAYVRLKVRLGVRLRDDANDGYYKSVLNDELQRYLAPWAYDRSADIVFGGKINSSLIVNFVEKRPYVDYVAGIKLFISQDGRSYTTYNASGEGSTLLPEAILVSDHSHQIDLITEESYEEEFFTGISYLKIELDFQVAAA